MSENYQPVQLPSKNRVYQVSEPIQLRTLKGKDEKLIAELNYDNFEKKFALILKNMLVGIDPFQLTLGDRLYIMYWLIINSISPKIPITFNCDTCLKQIKLDADLSKVEVTQLSDSFAEPYTVQLSTGPIQLRLFRVEDEIKISEFEKAGQSSYLYRYALSIVDGSNTVLDKLQLLENMSSADFMKIRAFHEKFMHGPKPEYKYDCPHCGVSGVTAMPFRIEYFIPYGEVLTRSVGNEI